MEIGFSDSYTPVSYEKTVEDCAQSKGARSIVTSSRRRSVRFQLFEGLMFCERRLDEAGHDRVIRALLTLDPDATVRTARAVYEGLEDFERQCKARNS